MSPDMAVRITFRNLMRADPTCQTILAMPNTSPVQYAIFNQHVDPLVAHPYVTMSYYAGGEDNDAQHNAYDALWKVCGNAYDNEALAEQLYEAVYGAIHRQPTINTDLTDWVPYTWVEHKYPYYEMSIRQNRPFYERGGIYRIRLAELCQP